MREEKKEGIKQANATMVEGRGAEGTEAKEVTVKYGQWIMIL